MKICLLNGREFFKILRKGFLEKIFLGFFFVIHLKPSEISSENFSRVFLKSLDKFPKEFLQKSQQEFFLRNCVRMAPGIPSDTSRDFSEDFPEVAQKYRKNY